MFRVAVSLAGVIALPSCHAHLGWWSMPHSPRVADGTEPAAPLELAGACPRVTGGGPVMVLLHGIGGEAANWAEVHQVLTDLEPAAMLSVRWSAMEETGALVTRLATGLEHLARCTHPQQPLVVFAHSAGGVLAAMALSRLDPSPVLRDLPLVTVASRLSGAGYESWRLKLLPIQPFALTVGGKIHRYTAPPPGTRVVHVRTHPASEPVMRQTASGHLPDDPRVVVPGAIEHSLPVNVGHEDALLWAARALVASPRAFGVSAAIRA